MSTVVALGLADFHVAAEDNYHVLGPGSQVDPDVPHGFVQQQVFNAGTGSVFPGTRRDYWIYVPRQYDGDKPAALMVFQDGGGYLSPTDQWRVPVVFDNLIPETYEPRRADTRVMETTFGRQVEPRRDAFAQA